MPSYKAPLRDMQFLLHEVFGVEDYYQSLGYNEVNRDLVDAILTESAKFAENDLDPCRQSGDEIGAKLEDGKVTTPPGFTDAYVTVPTQECVTTYANIAGANSTAICKDTLYNAQTGMSSNVLPNQLGLPSEEVQTTFVYGEGQRTVRSITSYEHNFSQWI